MAILVLGNGFDIAHKLPTKYQDFLRFVECYESNLADKSEGIREFVFKLKSEDTEVAKEVEDLLNKKNGLLDYFLSLYEKRCSEGKDGWIDFEQEIAQIIKELEYLRTINTQNGLFDEESFMRRDRIINKMSLIIRYDINKQRSINRRNFSEADLEYSKECLYQNLCDITRLLEIYLVEYIEKLEIKVRIPEIEHLENVYKVISFNYTDTYRKLYGNESVEYCFIHGKANNDSNVEKCNLVLGIDEYLDDTKKDQDNKFLWFKKFYQRIYKETSSVYIDWLDSHSHSNNMMCKSSPVILDIYFYGHSIDVTDRDVLNRLIMHKNSKIHIFYHDKDAMAKQISNLVKIIGEENLIDMTRGKNRTIEFLPIGKDNKEKAIDVL